MVICLRRLTPKEIEALAQRLGFQTRDAFEAAINALPSAKTGTTT